MSKLGKKEKNDENTGGDNTSNYKCGKCEKKVSNDDDAICCDICEIWFHRACENMPIEVYKYIQNVGNQILWNCQHCKHGCVKIYNTMKTIISKQEKLEEKMEQVGQIVASEQSKSEEVISKLEALRVLNENMVEQFEGVKNRLEATEKKTVEIEEECKLLKNNGVNGKEGIVVTAPLGDMGRLENKIARLEELRDEEARKNNTVIQGVPESAAEERGMRNKEDADFLKELFVGAMELDSNALVINKMFRLGTMNENSTRPRP